MGKSERIQEVVQLFDNEPIESLLELLKHSSDCSDEYCCRNKCSEFKNSFRFINTAEEFDDEYKMIFLCNIHAHDYNCEDIECKVPICSKVRMFKKTSADIKIINKKHEMIEKDTMSDGSDKSKSKYICQVCGAGATCFNFNVESCESCKAFFRRNALDYENKEFICKNGGNCIITEMTRKKCRRCRIDKCFNVGMKKDWIMTETELIKSGRKKPHEEIIASQPISSCYFQDMPNMFYNSHSPSAISLNTTETLPLPFNDKGNFDSSEKPHRRRRRYSKQNSLKFSKVI
jgi:hypothetical protein